MDRFLLSMESSLPTGLLKGTPECLTGENAGTIKSQWNENLISKFFRIELFCLIKIPCSRLDFYRSTYWILYRNFVNYLFSSLVVLYLYENMCVNVFYFLCSIVWSWFQYSAKHNFILKGVDLIDHTSILLLRTINHYVPLTHYKSYVVIHST